MPTIQDSLHTAQQRLHRSDTPRLDAQVLLCAVLGVNRAYLHAHPEQSLDNEQAERFTALVNRRAQGEPIAYILGHQAFYDRDFIVTPAVLIPRPETELLLEEALVFSRDRPRLTAVDVGTGSGALAVTFAAHKPEATVYATDTSAAALDVARRNVSRHEVDVRFMQGDLLAPLIEATIKVDLLMANLPYVARDELPRLDVTKHEPALALDGGPDGLDLVRRLLAQAPDALNPGALVLLEIGAFQGPQTLALVRDALHPESLTLIKDLAGLDRIVRAHT